MSFNFDSITLFGYEYVTSNGTLRLNLTDVIVDCEEKNFGITISEGEGIFILMMKRNYEMMKPYLAKNVNRFFHDYHSLI